MLFLLARPGKGNNAQPTSTHACSPLEIVQGLRPLPTLLYRSHVRYSRLPDRKLLSTLDETTRVLDSHDEPTRRTPHRPLDDLPRPRHGSLRSCRKSNLARDPRERLVPSFLHRPTFFTGIGRMAILLTRDSPPRVPLRSCDPSELVLSQLWVSPD